MLKQRPDATMPDLRHRHSHRRRTAQLKHETQIQVQPRHLNALDPGIALNLGPLPKLFGVDSKLRFQTQASRSLRCSSLTSSSPRFASESAWIGVVSRSRSPMLSNERRSAFQRPGYGRVKPASPRCQEYLNCNAGVGWEV
ncbi:hypothetical protein M8818_005358 [Zalaria obscura]|uniref:Uncharacterized protein n=1 Tax=Zalaria obscura TaxID=2024903 RepID=A0ACC3SA04_9PEZI